nr:RecName: Full=Unknown protein 6 [Daucus carota]
YGLAADHVLDAR